MKHNARNTKKHPSGFTLIELTIAIAFISILFLAIGTTTSGIIAAYKKGISFKLVNSTSHDLIDNFTSALQESPSIDFDKLCDAVFNPSSTDTNVLNKNNACKSEKAYHLIYQQWGTNIKINNDIFSNTPVFGAFCTGKYSYVWNTGYTFSGGLNSIYEAVDASGNLTSMPYIDGNYDNTSSHFRLAKFTDPAFSICSAPFITINDSYENIIASTNLDNIASAIKDNIDVNLSNKGTELISQSTTPLAIYDLVLFPPAQDVTTNRLYHPASMILATISGGVNIMSTGHYCTVPAELELSSDFSYCAVNKFNFAIRATGE